MLPHINMDDIDNDYDMDGYERHGYFVRLKPGLRKPRKAKIGPRKKKRKLQGGTLTRPTPNLLAQTGTRIADFASAISTQPKLLQGISTGITLSTLLYLFPELFGKGSSDQPPRRSAFDPYANMSMNYQDQIAYHNRAIPSIYSKKDEQDERVKAKLITEMLQENQH